MAARPYFGRPTTEKRVHNYSYDTRLVERFFIIINFFFLGRSGRVRERRRPSTGRQTQQNEVNKISIIRNNIFTITVVVVVIIIKIEYRKTPAETVGVTTEECGTQNVRTLKYRQR